MATLLEGAALGAALCRWHSGQGDPIYAVGSFLLAGKQHYRGVVKLALNAIERDISRYDAVPTAHRTRAAIKRDRHWGPKERKELALIARSLRHGLAHGHFSSDPAGLVSQAWLDDYEPKEDE